MSQAIINIDGGSRGNPGLAAFAYIIVRQGESSIEFADTIEKATNNVAEYSALVAALEKCVALKFSNVKILSDSELLVKQMLGVYRVKHPDLQPFHEKSCRLARQIAEFEIEHIRREQNKRADELCNIAMDAVEKKTKTANTSTSQATQTKLPKKTVTDAKVREDAVMCLLTAAQAWSTDGLTQLQPEMVWDQLWSLLEENGLLKVTK